MGCEDGGDVNRVGEDRQKKWRWRYRYRRKRKRKMWQWKFEGTFLKM